MIAKYTKNLITFCYNVSLSFLLNSLTTQICKAQSVSPNPPTPEQLPSPQDVEPPAPDALPTPSVPEKLPPPSELLEPSIPTPEPSQPLPDTPQTVTIEKFEVVGSTVFSQEELAQVLKPFTNKPITFAQLSQASSAITQFYIDNKYITSGAYLPAGQSIDDGVVKIVVIEGKLEDIEIVGTERLRSNYIRSRIIQATKPPLNQEKLLESLQLLQIDPLIENISAKLSNGTRSGFNILSVRVKEAPSFDIEATLDNNSSPSIGSFRRRIQVNEANLLGLGDGVNLAYSNTNGSNALDLSYSLPLNSRNGTLSFNYSTTSSDIIEHPFDLLDIESSSSNYELTFRQPLVRTPRQEFALGLTASRRSSKISSSLSFFISPNELSPGADDDGRTRLSALRFFQEWNSRNSREVIAVRSQFSLGLGAFNATVNGNSPDSRFFAWRGQAQWLRLLAPDTLLLIRGGAQLASERLLPSEQFSLGGIENVRGYRQNFLLRDNGAFASAEVQLPILRAPEINGLLQLAPFIDIGTTWESSGSDNSDVRDTDDTKTLASVGLGLRWSQGNNFTARLDWGIPLISVENQGDSLQENGLYFLLQYNPF